jgi:hypothetical protein
MVVLGYSAQLPRRQPNPRFLTYLKVGSTVNPMVTNGFEDVYFLQSFFVKIHFISFVFKDYYVAKSSDLPAVDLWEIKRRHGRS